MPLDNLYFVFVFPLSCMMIRNTLMRTTLYQSDVGYSLLFALNSAKYILLHEVMCSPILPHHCGLYMYGTGYWSMCLFPACSCFIMDARGLLLYWYRKDTEDCCSMGYQWKTHLELKSHENLFSQNIYFNYEIILKIYTEHGSGSVILCS